MFPKRLQIVLLGVLLALLPSCKAVSSLIHDGEVVAKLGDHKLYRSELDDVIPKGTSPEDSVNLANLYINSWVRDKAFMDIAQQRLSKEEKDYIHKLVCDYMKEVIGVLFGSQYEV